MKLSIFIDAAILLLLLFFLKKKKLFLLENLLLIMVLEFLTSTYCAILFINLDVWKIAEQTDLFIIFRIYEVVVNPVIWLLSFNFLAQKLSSLTKILGFALVVGIQVVVEQWLRNWGVIVYLSWEYWQSILVHVSVLLTTYVLFQCYRKLLHHEGGYRA